MSVSNLASTSHFPYAIVQKAVAQEPLSSWIPGLSKRPLYRHGHIRWWSGSIDHFHSSVEISDVGCFIKNKTDLFIKWKYWTAWCKFFQAALGLCCIMAESTVSRPHREGEIIVTPEARTQERVAMTSLWNHLLTVSWLLSITVSVSPCEP